MLSLVPLSAFADEATPTAAAAAPSGQSQSATEPHEDFSRDVLPILRSNCLACHNDNLAEAGLSLETVETIREGGDSGPAIDREHPEASLLVTRARGEDEDIMPPEENAVGAQRLTTEQCDLLQRWIAAGAPDAGATTGDLELWQPLPTGLQAIYAVSFSSAGDRLAVGRGNSIAMHELPSGRLLQTLADPGLGPTPDPPPASAPAGAAAPASPPDSTAPAAHRDYVNALAFHPDGDLVASGDFRALKLWRQATDPVEVEDEASRERLAAAAAALPPVTPPETGEATQSRIADWDLGDSELRQIVRDSADQRAVTVVEGGPAKLWNWADGTSIAELAGDPVLSRRVKRQERGVARQQTHAEFLEAQIPEAEKLVESEEEARSQAEQSHQTLMEGLQAKRTTSAEAEAALKALGDAPEDVEPADAPAADAENRAALEKQREEAATAVESAEMMVVAAAQALAAAEDARDQAIAAVAGMKEAAAQHRAHLSELEKQIKETRQQAEAAQHEAIIAAVSPDGQKIAVAFAGGTVGVFASSDGRSLIQLQGGPESPERLGFVDGGWVVAVPHAPPATDDSSSNANSGGGDPVTRENAELSVWNIDSSWQLDHVIGDPLGESPFSDRIVALDFSPDGSWLVVGSGEPSRFGDIHLISVAEGKVVASWTELHSDVVLGVRVSPDGRQLATCGADRQVRLVDFPSGENMRSLEGHTHHVLSVDWQDDGRRLVSASADTTIKVWNLQTGEIERTIPAGGKGVTSLAFAGTTSQFAAASGEGKVTLYDANDGGQKRVYSAVTSFQHAVATDGDGEMLAAGGEDGTLRIWKTATPEPIH